MNKTNYNDIAHSFKHQVWVKQTHYAMNMRRKNPTDEQMQERRLLYLFLTSLDNLAFSIGNTLADTNENFDRDVFLAKAGMMKDSYRSWSFVPTAQYIGETL